MLVVAAQRARAAHDEDAECVADADESENWPPEAWWREHLPSWLIDSFQQSANESLRKNLEPWHFGSWLDAMKCPGWEWWSSSVEPERWVIKLWADSWPYAIGPLEYLVRVAGTDTVEVTERGPE